MERDAYHLSDFAKVLLIVVTLASVIATRVYDTWGVFHIDEVTAPEMTETLQWLDEFYRSPEGLQRPNGLVTDGTLDYAAVSNWLFRNYLQARSLGATPQAARDAVKDAIVGTPEWQGKHP